MEDIKENILRREPDFKRNGWKVISKEAKEFIKLCLNKNPDQRPSIQELFSHPWITDVPEDVVGEDI